MKVYIVKRDVDYEFGDVYGVYANRELAEKAMAEFKLECLTPHDDEWSVEEYEVFE